MCLRGTPAATRHTSLPFLATGSKRRRTTRLTFAARHGRAGGRVRLPWRHDRQTCCCCWMRVSLSLLWTGLMMATSQMTVRSVCQEDLRRRASKRETDVSLVSVKVALCELRGSVSHNISGLAFDFCASSVHTARSVPSKKDVCSLQRRFGLLHLPPIGLSIPRSCHPSIHLHHHAVIG
jgi:hypothetical protein